MPLQHVKLNMFIRNDKQKLLCVANGLYTSKSHLTYDTNKILCKIENEVNGLLYSHRGGVLC